MVMMQPSHRKWLKRLVSLVTVGSVVFLWFFLTANYVRELVFPSPWSVWQALTTLGLRLVEHSFQTLARVCVGWIFGVVLGITVGLGMTWNRLFFSMANPLIEAVRPLPPVALIPFFIIWFGLSNGGQVALVALGCFMVMAVNTYVSVTNIPKIYFWAAQSLRASKLRVYQTVVLPAILPSLVSGFRIAMALAFGVAVAAEFMGAQTGIGFLIMVARRTLNTNTILLGTIIIGIESYFMDRLICYVSDKLCAWNEKPLEAIEQM